MREQWELATEQVAALHEDMEMAGISVIALQKAVEEAQVMGKSRGGVWMQMRMWMWRGWGW